MIEYLEWNLYMYFYMVIFGICKLKIFKCIVFGKVFKKMIVFYNDLENMLYFV